jgi:hypothetical protein
MNTNTPSPALHAALDAIKRDFSNPNGRALTMARTMLQRRSISAARARYMVLGTMAADCNWTADEACSWLTRHLHQQRIRYRTGFSNVLPLDIEITKEARLLCRWLRRYRPHSWPLAINCLASLRRSPELQSIAS